MTVPANGANGITPATPVRLQLTDFLKLASMLLVLGTPITVFAFRLQSQVDRTTDQSIRNGTDIAELTGLVRELTTSQAQFLAHTERLNAMQRDIDALERTVERSEGHEGGTP